MDTPPLSGNGDVPYYYWVLLEEVKE